MRRHLVSSGAKWEAKVGYSRAVRVGRQIFVSGTTAVSAKGRAVGQGDARAQARRIFEIIADALAKAGACLEDVVRTRMFVTDIADADALGRAHAEVFGRIRPVATLVEVSRLVDPALLVEIEADAIAGSGGADAVILAGGKAKRMGRDKSRIRLGRRTLLGHARAAVTDAGSKSRVVATDLQPGLGPLGGIATALRSAKHSRVLFVGCDMPFLSGDLINEFLTAATDGVGPIFTQHKRGVGFPFVLSRFDVALVEKQIDRGALSLQQLAKRLKARTWQPPAEREQELFNINTPADLAEAKCRLKGAGC
ncbi:MAG: molybdopterin-guanine dinucleotide biosynthesis protein A/enamine deaminase RidA [Limisphaerales bacterium]|jgi:molybdopterin-guanine dinucleotide biosynthesis protein A/enamine deaminase RidA (YjgF/YER057c/UK114 family)